MMLLVADRLCTYVRQTVREAYKWLLLPTEMFINDTPSLKWVEKQISPSIPDILDDIERILKAEELLIVDGAPIHLKNLLDRICLQELSVKLRSVISGETCVNIFICQN